MVSATPLPSAVGATYAVRSVATSAKTRVKPRITGRPRIGVVVPRMTLSVSFHLNVMSPSTSKSSKKATVPMQKPIRRHISHR